MKDALTSTRARGILALTLTLMVVLVLLPPCIAAQGSTRVGLVIYTGQGDPVTMVVTVAETQPTGFRVLQASGVDLVAQTSALGVAVCSIEGTGCPATNCFCSSPSASWTYWHLEGDAWVYSALGAGSYRVSDGQVEGWSWGSTAPPVFTFEELQAATTSTSSGQVSAQQEAYPGPEPTQSYDPDADAAYPGPGETTAVDEPYPGPEETTEVAEPAETQAAGTPSPRPSYTPVTLGTVSATPSISNTPTPRTSPVPVQAVTQPVGPGTAATDAAALTTATPDRVAGLISTAVAQETEAEAAQRDATQDAGRSYAGFVVLALVLLAAIGYVYLLQRQRRIERQHRS